AIVTTTSGRFRNPRREPACESYVQASRFMQTLRIVLNGMAQAVSKYETASSRDSIIFDFLRQLSVRPKMTQVRLRTAYRRNGMNPTVSRRCREVDFSARRDRTVLLRQRGILTQR